MDSSDSSSDEESHLEFWNNWIPSTNGTSVKDDASNCTKNICNLKKSKLDTNLNSKKCNNWIPPKNFFKINRLEVRVNKTENNDNLRREIKQNQEIFHSSKHFCEDKFKWKKILHLNWDKRVELHDVSNITDGNLIWGTVNLGLFSHINLWINDYGNICGSAEGTVSKVGSTETSFISIANTKLLQKMLNISSSQWASLCEAVQLSRASLKFEAFKDFNMEGKTSLEKLWFFLCKRRHFFVDQCMLVRLSGAVKCLQLFKITPKLVVQEIKNMEEKSFL